MGHWNDYKYLFGLDPGSLGKNYLRLSVSSLRRLGNGQDICKMPEGTFKVVPFGFLGSPK